MMSILTSPSPLLPALSIHILLTFHVPSPSLTIPLFSSDSFVFCSQHNTIPNPRLVRWIDEYSANRGWRKKKREKVCHSLSLLLPLCDCYFLTMPCDDDDDEYTNLCNLCFLLFLFIYSSLSIFLLLPSLSHYTLLASFLRCLVRQDGG